MIHSLRIRQKTTNTKNISFDANQWKSFVTDRRWQRLSALITNYRLENEKPFAQSSPEQKPGAHPTSPNIANSVK